MANIKNEEENQMKNLRVTFRVFQAMFFGIFALGLSLMAGDISDAVQIPISNLSLTTTVFGLLGAIITGKLSKDCESW